MRAIVFGFDGYNTAGSIRCLGEIGIKPIVILISNKKKAAITRSKYIGYIFIVEDVSQGIEILKSQCICDEIIPIFATSDKVAVALDSEYEHLSKYFIFPNVGKQGGITGWMDKVKMCSFAEQCGVIVPKFWSYSIVDPTPTDLAYPCIIKPAISSIGSKSDIKKIISKDDFELYITKDHITKKFIIQEFIQKESEILIIGCRTISGKVIMPAYLYKTRWVGEGDASSHGTVNRGLPNYVNIDSLERFVSGMNYIGPFSIECGIKNDIPYFFEINLRNDGTIHYFTSVGVNIPWMWLNDSYKIDMALPATAHFTDEMGDIINVINGNLSFIRWIKDMHKSTVHKYYDKKDPAPFKVFFKRMGRVALATLYHRLKGENV